MRNSVDLYLKQALLLIAIIYIVCFGVLGQLMSPFDFDHLSSYYLLAWKYWTRGDTLLPAFNPFFCGGRTLGGDPQIPIFSPLAFLVPLLGPLRLLKWEMLAQLALGSFGLYQWLKYFEISKRGRLWGLFVFLCGGGVLSRFLVGHVTLGFYFLYPLLIWLSYRIETAKGRKLFHCLLLYWTLFIYCSLYKPNFIIYGSLPLLIEILVRCSLKKNWKPLWAFIGGMAWCGATGAVSLLPARQYFSDFPRTDDNPLVRIPLYAFLANLIFPLKAVPEKLYGSLFLQRHEYSVFVGPIALWAAWFGLKPLRKFRAEFWALIVFCVLSIWLGMGTDSPELNPLQPYTWFRKVWPGFSSIRVPVRFWFSAFCFAIVASAAGVDKVSERFPKIFLWLGVLPLLVSATINLAKTVVLVSPDIQKHSRVPSQPIQPFYRVPFSAVSGSPNEMLGFLKQNKGILNCADNVQVYRAPIEPGEILPHVTTIDAHVDALRFLNWQQIEIIASRATKSEFEISINLNHSNYWKAVGTAGKIISKNGEKLKVRSEKGKLSLLLNYEQPWLREGFLLSGFSWLLFLLLLVSAIVPHFKIKIPPPKTPDPGSRLLCNVIFSYILLMFAGVVLGSAIRSNWEHLETLAWKAHPITVKSSRLIIDTHQLRNVPPYRIETQVQDASGQTALLESQYHPKKMRTLNDVNEEISRFFPGRTLIAYADDEGHFVLERSLDRLFLALLLPFCFVFLGCAVFWRRNPTALTVFLTLSALSIAALTLVHFVPDIQKSLQTSPWVKQQCNVLQSEFRFSTDSGGRYLNLLFRNEPTHKAFSQFIISSDKAYLTDLLSRYSPGSNHFCWVSKNQAILHPESNARWWVSLLFWIVFMLLLWFGRYRIYRVAKSGESQLHRSLSRFCWGESKQLRFVQTLVFSGATIILAKTVLGIGHQIAKEWGNFAPAALVVFAIAIVFLSYLLSAVTALAISLAQSLIHRLR